MVMTSQAISGLASSQAAMFGQFQSYAQQITPPYSSQPGMGYGAAMPGYSTGPAPLPPPMPAWSPHTPSYGGGIPSMMMHAPNAMAGTGYGQAMGERIMGAGLQLGSAGVGIASAGMTMAPLLGMGMGALGIGGGMAGGLAALGGGIGLPITAGIAAAGYGIQQMGVGLEQRQAVNQVLRNRFGGAMGVGGGRGGRGFSTEEMGSISTMVREMGTEDVFESMESLTRVMDRTAQMGVYRGVESARQFKTKFKQTVDALKEIANTMNTTLEGATEFMQQSRQMGFFSGSDISRNLMQTRLGAAATGMSVPQMQQIGQMGSQMGMSMGWRGRTGAQAAQNVATTIGSAVRTGALSDEQMFEATGGLTGAEGVQALTGRMMQVNNRFLSRGAGRVLTAAMWDPETGGINQEVMERIQRGEISFQEARSMGRRNISRTGGRQSEFFSQEERIRGQAMESGGFDLTMGMIEGHFRRRGGMGATDREGVDLDSPAVQRFLRRRMGMSQSEVEAFTQMRREMPRIMSERRQSMRQEVTNMVQTRRREGQGLQGVQRRWSQWWERSIQNPIRQAADDMTTTISRGIEDALNEIEGRIQTEISSQTRSQIQQWARTGERPSGMMSQQQFQQFSSEARSRGANAEVGEGFFTDLGRAIGARGPGMIEQLRSSKAYQHGLPANASTEERAEFLQRMQRDLSVSASELGVGSAEMKRLGSIALDEVYGSMTSAQRQEWITNRSNKDKALSMAKDRIRQLKKREEFREYFAKAKNWHQGYALLADLEEEAGLGVLGIDAGALPGGGSDLNFRRGLEGARMMQKEAIDKIVALSGTAAGKEGSRAGWGEKILRGGMALGSLGASEANLGIQRRLFGKDIMQTMFGRDEVEGAPIDASAAERLLKNNELREDLRLARKGDKAARQRLTKASLAIGESGAGSQSMYGESVRDRRDLRTMLDMVTSGSEQERGAIDQYLQASSGEQRLLVEKTVKASAAKLSRFTARNQAALEEGMGEEAFSKYQKIIELQESGDLGAASAAEKEFYQAYGGSKEGNFLLAHLRKGGVGGGMQEGLAAMSDYTRFFRSGTGKRKAKTLLEMTLSQAGIRGRRELRKLLGRGFMRKVIEGKIGAGELAQALVGKMTEEQLAGLADRGMSQQDFVSKLRERIELGEGGVDMDEVRRMVTGQATDQAWGARLDEAPKEEVDPAAKSLLELRKTNKILQMIYLKGASGDDVKALKTALKNIKGGEGGGDGE